MDYKNLFAKESTVSVQIMKVEGKKLTASLINQFKREHPFDDFYNFSGEKIFGYVKLKVSNGTLANIIIAQKNGDLIQFRDTRLKEISNVTEQTTWANLKNVLNVSAIIEDENLFSRRSKKNYDEDEVEPMSDFLEQDEIEKIFEVRDRVRKFLNELYNHQIYI